MLGAKLVYDPKIKVVPLIKYYNFALVNTSMQSLYHIVQTRSNMLHSNYGIHLNYDLVTKLALAMNTKVFPNDIPNMFKIFLGSHNHCIHWLHIKLSRSTCIASLKYLIRQSDLHEHYSTSHPKYSYDVLVTHINHLHVLTHDHMHIYKET